MYEMAAPPAFLLTSKLDPIFAQSKQYLATIGTPTTESDQVIYNQVCCGPSGFGTHFVGSVIVGGRATINTFVNSSFHSEYSHSTVSEQVSIGFDYEKLHLSLNDDAQEVEDSLMEDFKNSSHRRVTFEPDLPEILEADAPWLAWEIAAANNPTVVNTSVSSIANLFYENPDVMSHMQRTIDFYIENGQAPTLAELQGLHKSLNHPYPLVPGLQIVGCGFDGPSLTHKNCLFETASDDFMVWENPYYPDIKYSVPMGFYALDTPESILLNGTIHMESIDDYVEQSVWSEHHHHSGFLGFGSKDETTTTEKYYRMFYAHTYSLVLSLKQIAWYSLSLMEFPLPKFSSVFEQSLDFLPKKYDPKDSQMVALYEMFFNAFGTSVVTESDMGGLVWAETWFESCLERAYTDVCIDHEVHHGWWIVHDHDHEHSCDTRLQEDFANYSEWHFEMLGGTSQVNISDWEDWSLTVKYDPRPVKMTLVPIYYLLADSHPTKQALIDATNDYLARNEQEKVDRIDSMTNVRPPPPSMCDKYEDITPSPPSLDSEQEIEERDDPADELCPIVGYHGLTCPSNKKFDPIKDPEELASNQLPKGVGLTLDVSTGDLKLPAWSFDFQGSTSTWTDPASQDTYLLPKGLSLNADVSGENVPQTNVFKTASDLTSVWESGYEAGNWLGGEFGNSKSMIDLYEKFFSKQQSTSINQHPTGLYRLTLSDNWEQNLNAYAKAALMTLPEAYDANIYNRFMDTWGTHVAKDTLVGGMFEQQVVMKDCMWQSPYLTGGLTQEQLLEYLTMDLAGTPPVDSFYSARRQMNIDHRIGGNPELTDQTSWLNTLSKNPALLKIYSHVIWSEVALKSGVVSGAVIANLEQAITSRMADREAEREQERQEVEKRRLAELQGPRSVVAVVAHGRRGSIAPSMETGKYLTMNGYADCPAGLSVAESKEKCNSGVYIESWNSHHVNEPLRYERNAQGDMSSIRCYDLDNSGRCLQHSGPFIRNGCSLMPKADGSERPLHEPVPASTVVAMVCADCEVMASSYPQDSTLKCVCPGYTKEDSKYQETPKNNEECNGTFQPNGMPNFKQCNPEWKCHPYAGHQDLSSCTESVCTDGSMNNNICISGCGIVTSAMLLNYYGYEINPPELADYLIEAGFRDDLSNTTGATCNGVSHTAICNVAEAFGRTCEISDGFDELDQWLEDGPVIAHLRHKSFHTCKFTRAGHYVAIVKKNEDGSYEVSDSNSCEDERTHGTVEEISKDCSLVGFIRMKA